MAEFFTDPIRFGNFSFTMVAGILNQSFKT